MELTQSEAVGRPAALNVPSAALSDSLSFPSPGLLPTPRGRGAGNGGVPGSTFGGFYDS